MNQHNFPGYNKPTIFSDLLTFTNSFTMKKNRVKMAVSDFLGVSEDKLIIGAPMFHGEWGW